MQERSSNRAAYLQGSVDELEGLSSRLPAVLERAVAEAYESGRAQGRSEAAARGAETEQATQQAVASAVRPLEAEIASLRARLREARSGAAAREAALHEQGCLRLQRFVDMLYIAATLDPFAMQHEAAHYERQICLGYAQQAELTDLAAFARLVTSRCFHSHLSHAEALYQSRELALRALTQPWLPVVGEGITGADLAATVDKVLGLEYVTLVPAIPGMDACMIEGQLSAGVLGGPYDHPVGAMEAPPVPVATPQPALVEAPTPSMRSGLPSAAAAAASGENLVDTFFGKQSTFAVSQFGDSGVDKEAVSTESSAEGERGNAPAQRQPEEGPVAAETPVFEPAASVEASLPPPPEQELPLEKPVARPATKPARGNVIEVPIS
ncbi:hypothetical protein QBZ16_002285 [Prototheca wickerhamii]|uniref:Uncharacterized protein n=1 Tax=Prototheca wickerhamii TaxID=3111 RepID=A0AAD9MLL1_PROWI|nr:hypothetical protein QBZ16_002285 [Prototheca wickerhamii]